MAAGVPARLTAAQGRRFGLTVGGAFLAFAAIAWWRGHPMTTNTLAALGTTLTALGLLIPTYLGPVERAWMRLAHILSKMTTPLVMGVMFLLVLTPIGFLRRTFGSNPLVHQPAGATYWKARAPEEHASDLTRQY